MVTERTVLLLRRTGIPNDRGQYGKVTGK
jgi:hypothetical protein